MSNLKLVEVKEEKQAKSGIKYRLFGFIPVLLNSEGQELFSDSTVRYRVIFQNHPLYQTKIGGYVDGVIVKRAAESINGNNNSDSNFPNKRVPVFKGESNEQAFYSMGLKITETSTAFVDGNKEASFKYFKSEIRKKKVFFLADEQLCGEYVNPITKSLFLSRYSFDSKGNLYIHSNLYSQHDENNALEEIALIINDLVYPFSLKDAQLLNNHYSNYYNNNWRTHTINNIRTELYDIVFEYQYKIWKEEPNKFHHLSPLFAKPPKRYGAYIKELVCYIEYNKLAKIPIEVMLSDI
jgi:hypothetical protein